MRKYFKRKSDGKQLTEYGTISNGQLLTVFDEKTGTPICNNCYQIFVTKEELKSDFEPLEFKLKTSDVIDNAIAKVLPGLIYQFRNYGVAENQAQCFEEFYQSSSYKNNVYKDIAKQGDKAEFKDFLLSDDDGFEFGDAEDMFNMISGGFVPELKKMLIEFESNQGKE